MMPIPDNPRKQRPLCVATYRMTNGKEAEGSHTHAAGLLDLGETWDNVNQGAL